MSLVRRVMAAAGWRWPAALGADLAGTLATLGRPACCAVLLDAGLAGRVAVGATVLLAGCWLVRLGTGALRDRWLQSAGERVAAQVRRRLMASATEPGVPALVREAPTFATQALRPPVDILGAALRSVGAAVLLGWLHPDLLVALVPVAVLLPLVVIAGRRRGATVAGTLADRRLDLRRRWTEARQAPDLRPWLAEDLTAGHEAVVNAETRMVDATAWAAPVAYGLMTLGVALALVPGAQAVAAGSLTTGGLAEGLFLIVLALGPIPDLLTGIGRWWQVQALAGRLAEVQPSPRPALAPREAWRPWGVALGGPARVAWAGGGGLNLPEMAVAAGSVLVIRGPSGSGKSTLLRCLAGEQALAGGSVQVDGQRPRIGPGGIVLLTQDGRCPATTPAELWQDVGLGPAEAATIATSLGLAELLADAEQRQASSLPEETLQAVLLVAAAGTRPRLLLLDEATSALPAPAAASAIAGLARQGMTLVVASHRMTGLEPWPRLDLVEPGRG